jgi:hypothetical protein
MTVPGKNAAMQGEPVSPARRAETPAELAARLLPEVARAKAAAKFPLHVGATHFYEVGPGWETRILENDAAVCKTHDSFELEEAFSNPDVSTILIPGGASVSRAVALQICTRHSQAKTVFFEEGDHG